MKNFVWALVIVIILGGGYYLLQGGTPVSDEGSVVENTMPVLGEEGEGVPEMIVEDSSSAAPALMTTTITYDGKSFTPGTVTIKKGGTVTWLNKGTGKMWVASAMHPTHMVYSGTSREEHCPDPQNASFDQCGANDDFSFTFDKAGSWGFHDHLNSSVFGKVEVVE
ncbi:hypothetical protein A2853_00825 [Candidatus Kaiserbacteria bacterium RIFCSPHIGHO2_01_FULL_55_17]|uniref:EfeO-type cupredoxin-like domain-containing protein n=1 Tax=Candidatus Kaiserbacteria bacterium RIFCSPHIGHO2_01_FULL_55_17 TaxID=1798484 RepID=A0A1F6D989_9BACT|nr:MAG: hypothetical protein A2853_00825 [Candidatus Kaiserbacteria bacterium RIFCSPHIGHO2_01_FULL_55_17]